MFLITSPFTFTSVFRKRKMPHLRKERNNVPKSEKNERRNWKKKGKSAGRGEKNEKRSEKKSVKRDVRSVKRKDKRRKRKKRNVIRIDGVPAQGPDLVIAVVVVGHVTGGVLVAGIGVGDAGVEVETGKFEQFTVASVSWVNNTSVSQSLDLT